MDFWQLSPRVLDMLLKYVSFYLLEIQEACSLQFKRDKNLRIKNSFSIPAEFIMNNTGLEIKTFKRI